MTRRTIAFEQSVWDGLTAELGAAVETAWVLQARIIGEPVAGDLTLLVYSVTPVPDDAYDVRAWNRLSIGHAGWLPTFRAADEDGTVPVFVHTHPGGASQHSKYDLQVDDELARVAAARTSLGHYASLVVGGNTDAPTVAGRFKTADGDWVSLDSVRVVGERLTLLPADSSYPDAAQLGVFDRQVRAFGEAGQRVLGELRVGVVGAGGTGSAVIEQLVRLGVTDIVTIDPETLTDSNVTRVYGSTLGDVDRPKVDIAADHASKIGLGATVRPRQGRVLSLPLVEELLHCDIVFGCTDDNAGRLVLTRLPQALLQLFVDCGVVIDSRGGEVFEIFGRVSIVTPTSACLVCMSDIDTVRASAEAMSQEEHQARLREGYAPELDTTDPSVITYTTITASFAVNELLSRLFGYADDEPANRILIRIGSRAISKSKRLAQGTHRCTRKELVAIGTRTPFLDYGWRDE